MSELTMCCIHGVFAAKVLRPRVWATTCPTCKAGTSPKRATTEPRDPSLRGYPLYAIGRRMGPLDDGDTRDLWEAGK